MRKFTLPEWHKALSLPWEEICGYILNGNLMRAKFLERLDTLLAAGPLAFTYEHQIPDDTEPMYLARGTVDFSRLTAEFTGRQKVDDEWVTMALEHHGVRRRFRGADSDEWTQFPDAGMGTLPPGVILALYFATEVLAKGDDFTGVIEADPAPPGFTDHYEGSVHELVAGLLRDTRLKPVPFRFSADTGTLTILGHTLRVTPTNDHTPQPGTPRHN